MIDVEETDRGLRVTDAAKNEVEIEIDDWVEGDVDLSIDRELDRVVSGTASEVRLSKMGLLIESDQIEGRRTVLIHDCLDIPDGHHLLHASSKIPTYIFIKSPVKIIAKGLSEGLRIILPPDGYISLGFRTIEPVPRDILKIPPTTEGFSNLVQHFGSLHTVDSPDRSFPSMRPSLPGISIKTGTSLDFPTGSGSDEVRLSVPDSFEYLFPLAPLAYYVGASIDLDSNSNPFIQIGKEKTVYLPTGPDYSYEISTLLYRIFYLDCLVREAGKNAIGLREYELLDGFQERMGHVYESPIEERLIEYLNFPFESISSNLPDWPLSMHIDPCPSNLILLPFVLERLSMVVIPRRIEVDPRVLLERSIRKTYRSSADDAQLKLEPVLASSQKLPVAVHGWVADGTPLNAFKCLPDAVKNQLSDFCEASSKIDVVVILNDPSMRREFSNVVDIYHNRSKELSINVSIFEETSCGEMASILESPHDFVHYIGHCEEDGFLCMDGVMAVDSIDSSRVRSFFLNACGSYVHGIELIKKGSFVGGVTIGDVVDGQALEVGDNFAKFVTHGFSFDRSLYYSRNHALMNQYYSVIGDGTFSLSQGNSTISSLIEASRASDGMYFIRLLTTPFKLNGGFQQTWVDDQLSLMGNHPGTTVSKSAFVELLKAIDSPVLFENGFYWPEEFLDEHI